MALQKKIIFIDIIYLTAYQGYLPLALCIQKYLITTNEKIILFFKF